MGTAKIIVSIDGLVKQEVELSKDRIAIGRRPYNDIVLDNPAISGEHAMIVKSHNDCILEDLGSTNGTYVNGQPVKKHFLQNNDVIELIKYRLQYIDSEHATAQNASIGVNTALLPQQPGEASERLPAQPASLEVMKGNNAGKTLALVKEITTLGSAETQLAAIIRKPEGYFIQHIKGANGPLVNDHPIGTEIFPLMDGDLINMSGTQVRFSML